MSAAGLLALGAAQTACGGASAAPAPAAAGAPAWGGPIDPARTAVLVMHYQSDILAFFPQAAPTLLANTRALLDAARTRGTSIYFIRIAFSPNYLEVSPRNKNGSFLATTGAFLNNDIPAELAPRADEPVLVAKRVSVFFGTDLESRLSARNIDTVVLAGIASTGVVLSSIAHASDADYRIYTVKDCCFDPDQVVHDHLFQTAFESRSVVMSLDQAAAALRGS
ncbi:MAG TPA: isochorismatase family cysteine hydrolase [Burkholderiaceae bacterium]|nr:isochorismatase family cysteine hydrolase [Burkholderiaceae bacterium]